MAHGQFVMDQTASHEPQPWRGREFYLPSLAIGRLVESPSEIATAINAFLSHPQVEPVDAVVTGYDFLIDQAEAVSDTLTTQGVAVTPLISNDWTDEDFRTNVFVPNAYDLNSLNAHFQHDLLFPTDPLSQVRSPRSISSMETAQLHRSVLAVKRWPADCSGDI